MMDNSLLRAALDYAARGWHVLPCRPRDKTPLTSHGVHDASRDEVTIREWWTRWPDANIAIACGPSGLVVLDVDPRHGGDESLRDLYQELGRETFQTATALTGGGGQHLYFRADGTPLKNVAGGLGAGLDLKAAGGYVLAPPSVHPSGRAYEWELGYSPEERALLDFPQALANRLKEPSRRPQTTSAVIREGSRNVELTRLAGAMRARGMSEAAIAAALLAENTQRCDPPLPEQEVRRIAASIAKYEPNTARPGVVRRGGAFAESAGDIAWLWPGWLARGTVTVLAGQQGVGKTTLVLALAGTLTRGDPWPDGSPSAAGRALYVPSEGSDQEIAEKLVRVGAEEVDILTAEDGGYLTIARDYETILSLAQGYDMVVLDSLTGHALCDLRKSERARAIMNRLSDLARTANAAVVVLHHLRKATILDIGHGLDQDRVRDSQDILAAARMAWGLEEEKDGSLTFGIIKTNLAPPGRPLRLINDDDGITWLGEAEQEQEFAAGWERCAAWLKEQLRDGPQPSDQLRQLALATGFSPKQLRRARDEVVRRIQRLPNGHTLWWTDTPQTHDVKNRGPEGLEGPEGPEGPGIPLRASRPTRPSDPRVPQSQGPEGHIQDPPHQDETTTHPNKEDSMVTRLYDRIMAMLTGNTSRTAASLSLSLNMSLKEVQACLNELERLGVVTRRGWRDSTWWQRVRGAQWPSAQPQEDPPQESEPPPADDPWRDYPYRREPEPPDGGWVGEDVHWPRLVAMAYEHDTELGATLKTFAEMGRHLVRWDGTLAIQPADEADREGYARDREYLLPYSDWLREALYELASLTKEVTMAA